MHYLNKCVGFDNLNEVGNAAPKTYIAQTILLLSLTKIQNPNSIFFVSTLVKKFFGLPERNIFFTELCNTRDLMEI